MTRLVATTLERLAAADPGEGIELAQSFFELANGNRLGLWHPEVRDQPATAAELEQMSERLVALARSGPPSIVGSAVFALGKRSEPDLIPCFIEVMRAHLDRDAGVLYQAMIALDNLDVQVFPGRDSMSLHDEDENRAAAAAFLAGQRGGADPAGPGKRD